MKNLGRAYFRSIKIYLWTPNGMSIDNEDELTWDLDNCSSNAHIYNVEEIDFGGNGYIVDYDISNDTDLNELKELCEYCLNKHLKEE